MAEVIPAIIAKDFRELKKKIKLVEPYIDWVQLDIMDGKFVPNETWREPKKIKKIITHLKFEAHLMVQNSLRAAEDWLRSGAQRVIVHWEILKKLQNPELKTRELIKKIHRFKKEIGIALNPETDWKEIKNFIPELDLVLLMAVNPGFGGQEFVQSVIPKIRSLHESFPNVKIEVDGGINEETGKLAMRAGANILVAGSAIFESKDIEKTILEMKNIV